MKKQNKQKIINIWNKIKKPLMIFSIIFNIIFIISIIVGCATQKKQVKTTNNEEIQEVSKDDNTIEEDGVIYHRKKNISRSSTTPTTLIGSWTMKDILTPLTGSSTISYDITFTTQFYSGNSSSPLNKIYMPYYSNNVQSKSIQLSYVEAGIYLKTTDTFYISNTNFNNSGAKDGEGWYYHVSGGSNISYVKATPVITITGGADVQNSTLLNWFIDNSVQEEPEPEPIIPEYEDVTKIYLGDSFVPSVYVTQNGQFILNGYAGYHSSSDTFALVLDGFTFVSNDTTFNKITLLYGSLNAMNTYVTTDGTTLTDVSSMSNYMCCIAIKYAYVNEEDLTERNITVASMRKSVVTENNVTLNVTDVRSPFVVWVNEAYRTLTIVEDTRSVINGSYLTIENMSSVQLLQVTSNVSTSAVGLSDVNSLLKGAFSALSSLFGLSILPGLTLGLLLFLPLVVTILIAVIRLIRK